MSDAERLAKSMYEASDQGPWEAIPWFHSMWISAAQQELDKANDPKEVMATFGLEVEDGT